MYFYKKKSLCSVFQHLLLLITLSVSLRHAVVSTIIVKEGQGQLPGLACQTTVGCVSISRVFFGGGKQNDR